MAEYYDREKLYKEVWESPMIEVCKKYGVSDVALAKTCKKLKVPRPSLGYWAKKAAGKEPPKPRMYPYDDAPKLLIRCTEPSLFVGTKQRLVPEAFEEAENLIKKLTAIKIADDFENLHPYVHNTRKLFKRNLKKGWKDTYGRISVSGVDVFTISNGEENLDRVSLILQTICSIIIGSGFEIVQSDSGVAFRIFDEEILISISEATTRQPISEKNSEGYSHKAFDYILSGNLRIVINTDSFSMDDRKSWSDNKNKVVEDQLLSIAQNIIKAAAWKKEERAIRDKREEELRIERREQIEKDRLARIESKRVAQLEAGYKSWVYHKELSEYVNAVISHYLKTVGEPDADFAEWMKWAEQYLEKVNPLNGEYPRYVMGSENKFEWF